MKDVTKNFSFYIKTFNKYSLIIMNNAPYLTYFESTLHNVSNIKRFFIPYKIF